MKLECLKDIKGIVERKKGDIINYIPYKPMWQDMNEEERIQKGIYVICYGMGEFEVLKEGVDVIYCL